MLAQYIYTFANRVLSEEPKFVQKHREKSHCETVSALENEKPEKYVECLLLKKETSSKCSLYLLLKKLFFVSTFLDCYNCYKIAKKLVNIAK